MASRILPSEIESSALRLSSPEFAPETSVPEWERVCKEAGTRYRGYVRERIVDGKRYPFLVLFNDRYSLVTGLPRAEFNPQNIKARLLERASENTLSRRVSPEPRPRAIDSALDALARLFPLRNRDAR